MCYNIKEYSSLNRDLLSKFDAKLLCYIFRAKMHEMKVAYVSDYLK